MVVPSGREFLAIPGPTTMPDEVLRAMHRPALDIYSEQMVNMTESLLRDLSGLFATKGRSYIYTPTATAPGKRLSPTCCRAATRCWCWKAAGSPSAGATPPPQRGQTSKCGRALGAP